MTFLALNINATFLMSQKSDLELEELKYSNKYNEIVQEMAQYESSKSDGTSSSGSGSGCNFTDFTNYEDSSSSDSSSDDAYLESLAAEEKYYESKKAAIESQLKVINNELESYQKAIETNIKSECSFKISV